MQSPRENELFPLIMSKPIETLQLFDEGPSSNAVSTQGENEETITTRFKGVVQQQNGHWGAQIYVHHSRIWLGTFKSEMAAARAYDSAAIRFHRGDSHRNFTATEVTAHEPAFQAHFASEAILDMIRDGSYELKLIEFIRTIYTGGGAMHDSAAAVGGFMIREMFQKELTPSDVGKLNRLVIPKKHATRYFPPVRPDTVDELLLEFRDRVNRSWVFRYCYWKSSQSYVFTKGWNRFVKEMELRPKDVVAFYHCHERDGLMRKPFCMIDISRGVGGGGAEGGSPVEEEEAEEDEEVKKEEELIDVDENGEKKEMKLFGVWIR